MGYGQVEPSSPSCLQLRCSAPSRLRAGAFIDQDRTRGYGRASAIAVEAASACCVRPAASRRRRRGRPNLSPACRAIVLRTRAARVAWARQTMTRLACPPSDAKPLTEHLMPEPSAEGAAAGAHPGRSRFQVSRSWAIASTAPSTVCAVRLLTSAQSYRQAEPVIGWSRPSLHARPRTPQLAAGRARAGDLAVGTSAGLHRDPAPVRDARPPRGAQGRRPPERLHRAAKSQEQAYALAPAVCQQPAQDLLDIGLSITALDNYLKLPGPAAAGTPTRPRS